MNISGRYERGHGYAGGARVVRSSTGRVLGYVTRRFRASTIGSTTKVSAWRFEPAIPELEDRYFASELGESSMLLRLAEYLKAKGVDR